MSSRQVLKLCKKIEEQCGIICKPETFVANKNRLMVETGSDAWSMEVDMEKTKKLSDSDWDFICCSNYYIKDLLKDNVKLTYKSDIDIYCYSATITIYCEST